MTLDRATTDPRPLTGAAFRVTREYLGLTAVWVAERMRVQERTVLRWESEESPISERVRLKLDVIAADTAAEVSRVSAAAHIAEIAVLGTPDEAAPLLVTYRTDDDYRRHQPQSTWPASWHRAVVARAAEQLTGATITYWRSGG